MKRLQNPGLYLAISGAAISVLALALSCSNTFFGIDFGLEQTSVWGVPGVNGAMQLLLLIGAAMLLVGVIPMGREGLRYIVLEAQLTVSGIIFFTTPAEYVYPARFLVLSVTFYALWRLKLMTGPIVKIGSVGTELLGWGKALNSFSGLAAGGDLLFISSYLNYKRHGKNLDLLWTWLNLPFAVLAHLDLAAEMAAHMGWGEVIHIHIAGLFVLGGSWLIVMHFRTSVDLDGPHKPKPADELLPRFDLHWRWVEERSNWLPFGACGTVYWPGNPHNGWPGGTAWELDSKTLERRKRRKKLADQSEVTALVGNELDELATLDRELLPTIKRIEARWAEFGALKKEEWENVSLQHNERRRRLLLERRTPIKWQRDPLERLCNFLLPSVCRPVESFEV